MAPGITSTGRLPNLQNTRLAISRLRENQTELARLQEQLSTGERLDLPSDDPLAALQTLKLQQILERRDQFVINGQTTQGFLATSESALVSVSDILVRADSLVRAGIGNATSGTEKEAIALEIRSMMRGLVEIGNTQYSGRFLFAGSEAAEPPFSITDDGFIRYAGDDLSVDTAVDFNSLVSNNVDGVTAFGALSPSFGSDVNPALAAETPLASLNGGFGVERNQIVVTLTDGIDTVEKTIDVSGAQTIADFEARIENAFAGEALTLDVEIDPGDPSAIRFVPSAGTVTLADADGSRTAAQLGLVGGPAATLSSGDLNPLLSELTELTALNGGTGIGATAGTGLRISHGNREYVVDLDGATTVQDVLNRIAAADRDLVVGVNENGTGLSIRSRLSGASLSIGENGGDNAARLGIRTFDDSTLLADLNAGNGVPTESGLKLNVTRRDGTAVEIDLSGAKTVADVLNTINAVDPGNLVAATVGTGNGITLTDNSGTGPLAVATNNLSAALGLNGTESGTDPLVPLTGSDVSQKSPTGMLHLFHQLAEALERHDDVEITRVGAALQAETERFNAVRGELGARMQTLEQTQNRLLDQEVQLRLRLNEVFEADPTEVVPQILLQQQVLQSILQLTASNMQLTLLNFL